MRGPFGERREGGGKKLMKVLPSTQQGIDRFDFQRGYWFRLVLDLLVKLHLCKKVQHSMPALEKFTNRSIGRRRVEKNFNLKQASRPWEVAGNKVTVIWVKRSLGLKTVNLLCWDFKNLNKYMTTFFYVIVSKNLFHTLLPKCHRYVLTWKLKTHSLTLYLVFV